MTCVTATLSPTPRRARRPVTAHPAFPAMIGVWGAVLGALSIAVLPASLVETAIAMAGSDLIVSEARIALGGALGAALGLCCLTLGKLAGRTHRVSATARGPRGVEAIDPLTDLGSPSLDAPLVALADGDREDDDAWLPALDLESLDEPACPEVESTLSPPDHSDMPPPRALDLGEFAELPGRNAVWVEEPALDAIAMAGPAPRPAPSAIARLRAVPPGELSLCEMVERLAAALQEYQAAHDESAAAPDSEGDREALLNEALGALGRVTARGFAEHEAASGPALRAQMWATDPAQTPAQYNKQGAA
jgi:hypothetical protein